MDNYDLKIFTDTDCDIYIDGCLVTKLNRGSIYKVTLCEGDYIIQAKTSNEALVYRKTVTLCRNSVFEISFETLLKEHKNLISNMQLHPFEAKGTEKYGFMDVKSRAIVIPAIYDMVSTFNYKGFARVRKNKKYGIINKYGEEVIPIEYTGVRTPSSKEIPYGMGTLTCVLSGEKGDGVVDECGAWTLSPEEGYRLDFIHSVRSGQSLSHFYVFVDSEGGKRIFNGEKFISSESFIDVKFYNDIIVFKKKRVSSQSYHYGLMNCKGHIFETCFDYISGYQNGYAWASKGDEEGWINFIGYFEFIPDKFYDRYGPFDGKLALVRKGNKVGFINKANEEVIPFVYDAASPFTEDRAIVLKNGLIGMIDPTGREVCPCVYESFRKPNCMSFPLAIVKRDGKYGCINKDGELLLPCIYNDLWFIDKDFIAVKNEENVWGFVNDKNEQVIPFEYNLLTRSCHEYNTNKSYFWETIPSWQEDPFSRCRKTLGGCVVFFKRVDSSIISGIINKKGIVAPCQYGRILQIQFNSFVGKAIDSDDKYSIFPDGTILPISMDVI